MDSKTEAIIGLLLNILLLPGLGTVIWGNKKHGIWQLVLAVLGALLSIVLIGIPMIIAAWIWGLVSGIKMIQNA